MNFLLIILLDPTLPALLRLRGYVRGIGRYGPSPFLVGHYGGIGDISQGFCRAAAVSGGVYVLGRPIASTAFHASNVEAEVEPYIEVQLEDFPEVLKSRVIISSRQSLFKDAPLAPLAVSLPSSVPQSASNITKVARCVAILDTPIQFQPRLPTPHEEEQEPIASGGPLDTAVLIIPPTTVPSGSQDTAATVFINGENSLSTPKGRCKSLLLRNGYRF